MGLAFPRSDVLAGWLDGKFGRIFISSLEPVVVSASMFLVQGFVAFSSDKLEFATYSIAYSYVVMGQAVLSALFGGPLFTLLGRVTDRHDRMIIGRASLRMQLVVATAVAIIGLSAALFMGLKWQISALAALGMMGLSFRDALRSVLVAQLELVEALVVAIQFAIAVVVLLALAWLLFRHIGADLGLAVLATAICGTLMHRIVGVARSSTQLPDQARRDLLGMAVWSLPGAGAIWLQNSFYLTLVAIYLSMDAVAEISAARMVVMPLLVVTSGLLRLAQAQAAKQIIGGMREQVERRYGRLALGLLVMGGFLMALCQAAGLMVNPHYLPKAYPKIISLVGFWIAFASATTARSLFTSLYQAVGRYKELFVINIAILPFVLVLVAFLPRWLGVSGAILPMVFGEIVILFILSLRLRVK